jgi:hypothetical protein
MVTLRAIMLSLVAAGFLAAPGCSKSSKPSGVERAAAGFRVVWPGEPKEMLGAGLPYMATYTDKAECVVMGIVDLFRSERRAVVRRMAKLTPRFRLRPCLGLSLGFLTISLEGGLEEVEEFLIATASFARNWTISASRSAICCFNAAHRAHVCIPAAIMTEQVNQPA